MLLKEIQKTNNVNRKKSSFVAAILRIINTSGYEVMEVNDQKPWGAYIRLKDNQADKFIKEFFPDLSSETARLGVKNAKLSPKLLIIEPKQRLSWQYHSRRAERWSFLTDGAYYKSRTNNEGKLKHVQTGDEVQFKCGERHRLVNNKNSYIVVAEIWQHTNPKALSDENDIVRLADDYQR